MLTSEQLTVDRGGASFLPDAGERQLAERAAREALKRQVAKLERELSGLVAGRFPHVSPGLDRDAPVSGWAGRVARGPHLLSLGELELLRDRLALRVRDAQRQAARRSELEWDARELLERMRSEPARYKFVRLPVAALGERGCGVWEVRPRLGLIGMLAGWWQLKLSSGCPLPKGPRVRAAPPSRAAPRPQLPSSSAAERQRVALSTRRGEHRRERVALSIGHRSHRLGLRHRKLSQEFAAAILSPPVLTHEQVRDRHALCLPRAMEDHLRDIELSGGNLALELRAG
jgi:hypothetical protein